VPYKSVQVALVLRKARLMNRTPSGHLSFMQNNCTNSTDAPALERCWANRVFCADMGFTGLDPNTALYMNILLRFLNVTIVCEFPVDEQCLQERDPYTCFLSLVGEIRSSSSTSDGGGHGGGTENIPQVVQNGPNKKEISSTLGKPATSAATAAVPAGASGSSDSSSAVPVGAVIGG
jgi:hypothetical protein